MEIDRNFDGYVQTKLCLAGNSRVAAEAASVGRLFRFRNITEYENVLYLFDMRVQGR